MIEDTITIIASIAGILGIYQFCAFVWKHVNRPLISIGVLPVEELKCGKLSIRDIGTIDALGAMRFSEKFFSPRIKNLNIDQSARRYPDSVRSIVRTDTDEYDLALVIYNRGNSTLKDYVFFVTFSESFGSEVNTDANLELLNVETETATICALYVNELTYKGEKDSDKIPATIIKDAYKAIGITGHMVALGGSIGGGVYEIFALTLQIPKSVKEVAMHYHIDSPGNISKAFHYGQRIKICQQRTEESVADMTRTAPLLG